MASQLRLARRTRNYEIDFGSPRAPDNLIPVHGPSVSSRRAGCVCWSLFEYSCLGMTPVALQARPDPRKILPKPCTQCKKACRVSDRPSCIAGGGDDLEQIEAAAAGCGSTSRGTAIPDKPLRVKRQACQGRSTRQDNSHRAITSTSDTGGATEGPRNQ